MTNMSFNTAFKEERVKSMLRLKCDVGSNFELNILMQQPT
jgi:hypothetical protein